MDILTRNGRRNVPRSLQPTPEAAKSRLARLHRRQLMLRLEMKRALLKESVIPPAPDPLGP